MRKFTSIMLMLLFAVTTWAQDWSTIVSSEKCYTVTTKDRGAWAVREDGSQFASTNDCGKGTSSDANDPYQQFAILSANGSDYYLYSVGAAKFIKADRSLIAGVADAITFVDASSQGAGRIRVNFRDINNSYINLGGANQMSIDWWSSIDGGNAVLLTEAGDFDASAALEMLNSVVTITYSYKYNDVEVGTSQTVVNKNEAYPAFKVPYGFATEQAVPTGTATENETIDVVCTDNLPFAYSATADAISTWYYIQMHSNQKKYIQYVVGATNIEWKDGSMTSGEADSYSWAFVGDPVNGFKLVNKLAGTNQAVNTNGSTAPALGDINTAAVWKIIASSATGDGFCMQYPGGQNMNAQGEAIAFWGANDAGSTFVLTERPSEDAALSALIEKAETLLANNQGTAIGCYTSESVTKLSNAIATAKDVTFAEESDVTALQNVLDDLDIILPQENTFYTIQNNYSNIFIGTNDDGGLISKDEAALGEVFQFVPAADNTFYLYNVQRGIYLSTAKGHGHGQNMATATTTAEAKPVTITSFGTAGHIGITPAGGTTIHHDASYSTIVGWTGSIDSRSDWAITELEADITTLSQTINVSSVLHSTLILGFNATIPEGLECYKAVSAESNWVNLEKIDGVLPAGEAVIVKAAEGSYEFKYTNTDASTGTNLLAGTTITKNITPGSTAYVLSAPEGTVGLYPAKLTDGAFLNNANKAYLVIPNTEANPIASYSFNFDWAGTTGIEGVEAEGAQNGKIYDITGREVKAITAPGIYIVNGKKVVK